MNPFQVPIRWLVRFIMGWTSESIDMTPHVILEEWFSCLALRHAAVVRGNLIWIWGELSRKPLQIWRGLCEWQTPERPTWSHYSLATLFQQCWKGMETSGTTFVKKWPSLGVCSQDQLLNWHFCSNLVAVNVISCRMCQADVITYNACLLEVQRFRVFDRFFVVGAFVGAVKGRNV